MGDHHLDRLPSCHSNSQSTYHKLHVISLNSNMHYVFAMDLMSRSFFRSQFEKQVVFVVKKTAKHLFA